MSHSGPDSAIARELGAGTSSMICVGIRGNEGLPTRFVEIACVKYPPMYPQGTAMVDEILAENR